MSTTFLTPIATSLLDCLPDVVFFSKDAEGRYTSVSQTLLHRSNASHVEELMGRTAREVFPGPHGTRFYDQDRRVLESARPLREELEVHPYSNGKSGWCVTTKEPVLDPEGRVVGIAGISRDLGELDAEGCVFRPVANALAYMRAECTGTVLMRDVAHRVDISLSRFERATRRVFNLTPIQLLARIRMEKALELLQDGDEPIGSIATRCGYADHSAFTRQFRATLGAPPSAFRTRTSGLRIANAPN